MTKKALFVIVNIGFQDHEFEEPRRILDDAGVEITIASNKKGICMGAFGSMIQVDYSLEEIKGTDYDLVVMIGGPGAWPVFHNNPEYLRISKEAKLLGAICIAPTIVSDSGLYKGVEVTGWDKSGEQIDYLNKNGGIYTGENVTEKRGLL